MPHNLSLEILLHILEDVHLLSPSALKNCMLASKAFLDIATPIYFRSISCEIDKDDDLPFDYSFAMLQERHYMRQVVRTLHLISAKSGNGKQDPSRSWITADTVLRFTKLLPNLKTLILTDFIWVPFTTDNTFIDFAPNTTPIIYHSSFKHSNLTTIKAQGCQITTNVPSIFHLPSFTSKSASFDCNGCLWDIRDAHLWACHPQLPVDVDALVLRCCFTQKGSYFKALPPISGALKTLSIGPLGVQDAEKDNTWLVQTLKTVLPFLKALKLTTTILQVVHPFPNDIGLSSLGALEEITFKTVFPWTLHPLAFGILDITYHQLCQLPKQLLYCNLEFNFTSFISYQEHEDVPDIVLNTIHWQTIAEALQRLHFLQRLSVTVNAKLVMSDEDIAEWSREMHSKLRACLNSIQLYSIKVEFAVIPPSRL